jgi:hypothetical protein
MDILLFWWELIFPKIAYPIILIFFGVKARKLMTNALAYCFILHA